MERVPDDGGRPALSLALAGGFTLEPCEPHLRAAASWVGRELRLEYAGFGQVMQCLLSPAELFYRNAAGVNVLFVRPKDVPDAAELRSALARYDAAPAAQAPLCVVVCPQSEPPAAAWRVDGAGLGKVVVAHLPAAAGAAEFDARAEELAAVPYGDRLYRALGVLAMRLVSYVTRRPFKVACVDCDNTLWRGVVGEDGPEALVANLALQSALKRSKERGLMLVTCSKNVPSDVRAAFAAHPEWPLAYDDFVLHKEDWEPKGANIAAATAELGLTELQAVVFIDDNPIEVGDVQRTCPGASTVLLPTEAALQDALVAHLWPLDAFRATTEDATKTEAMRVELQRRSVAAAATDFAAFVASLELRVSTGRASADQLARVLQLTQKTNQFNFTTRRLAALPAGLEARVTHVADRYGDYGLVGVALVRETADALELDNLLMSCRTLGRGVEARMLAQVGELALARAKAWVRIGFVPTERNEPARKFLEAHGLLPAGGDGWQAFPAQRVAAVAFDPAAAAAPVAQPAAARGASGAAPLADADAEEEPATALSRS